MNLIVNADDFGRSTEINRAVIQAHRQGILTSASLMIAGEAADEAVALARANPSLAVGLHLVAVDGPAVLPHRQIPHLVDEHGRFPNSPVRLGLRYAFSRRAGRELAKELRSQFERFAATGLPLSHVDGHQHMHMHPAVFDLVLPLAREFGAGGIRIVRDDLWLALRHDRRHLASKVMLSVVFALLARRCRRRAVAAGMPSAQRTYGLMKSGSMSVEYVLDAIEQLKGSSAEIYFHPTAGEGLDVLGPNPGDLETLLSPRIRSALVAQRLQLSTYAQLATSEHGPLGCQAPRYSARMAGLGAGE